MSEKKSAEQVEQERLTRRQALRKFGFGAGLSAIMLLGADDLARMVGAKMRQMEGDSKVADQIAKEFQSAGVAVAGNGGGGTDPTDDAIAVSCQHCCSQLFQDECYCENRYGTTALVPNATLLHTCKNQASVNYSACFDKDCVAHGITSCHDPSTDGTPCPQTLTPPQNCAC